MTNTRTVIEISDGVFTEYKKAAVFCHLVICVYLWWVAGSVCACWPKIASCLASSVCEGASGTQGGNGLGKHQGI